MDLITSSENKENIDIGAEPKDQLIKDSKSEKLDTESSASSTEKIQTTSDIDNLSLSLNNSNKTSPEILENKKEQVENKLPGDLLKENISHFSESNILSKSPNTGDYNIYFSISHN